METLEKKIAADQRIMKILKLSELRYPIAQSNLGPIEVMIRFGEDKYTVCLDASPLEDEKQEQMQKILGLNK